MKLGNMHALLDVMIEQAKREEAVSGHDPGFGADFINMARDLGVPEDDIVNALCGSPDPLPCPNCQRVEACRCAARIKPRLPLFASGDPGLADEASRMFGGSDADLGLGEIDAAGA